MTQFVEERRPWNIFLECRNASPLHASMAKVSRKAHPSSMESSVSTSSRLPLLQYSIMMAERVRSSKQPTKEQRFGCFNSLKGRQQQPMLQGTHLWENRHTHNLPTTLFPSLPSISWVSRLTAASSHVHTFNTQFYTRCSVAVAW